MTRNKLTWAGSLVVVVVLYTALRLAYHTIAGLAATALIVAVLACVIGLALAVLAARRRRG